MIFSKLVEETAAVVANKIGCKKSVAVEMVENVVFNTECDLHSFFKSVLSSDIAAL